MVRFRVSVFYFLFSFCTGFILLFPIPYYFLPETGNFFEPLVLPFIKSIAHAFFGVSDPFTAHLYSDSVSLYVLVFLLGVISVLVSVFSVFLNGREVNEKSKYIFYTLITYFLALTLFKYGADKIFKHQFFLPEPNTLFTPVGQLTPDLLFWSSMGTSYSYTVFSGIMEIIPAVLLLFRKTRFAGALISTGVLINVVMINFGFDITVKIFSMFLLLCALILVSTNGKPLFRFLFRNENATIVQHEIKINDRKKLLLYLFLKTSVIGLFLVESFSIYFELNNLNDDFYPRPPLHGAYDVNVFYQDGKLVPASMENPDRFKRIFIHRRSYFIIQTMDDRFIDYDLKLDTMNQVMRIEKYWISPSEETDLYYKQQGNHLHITGKFFDFFLEISTNQINLDTLPLLRERWHWTIEDFRD